MEQVNLAGDELESLTGPKMVKMKRRMTRKKER
jgi:hypothetical protein